MQQMRSDYESMRRQAIEESRKRWEEMRRMRPAMPLPPQLGPPGYYPGPGSAPAHSPGQSSGQSPNQ
jgi:hypothetical protein